MLNYSKEEQEWRKKDYQRMINARSSRNQSWAEFNDLDFNTWYTGCQLTANSYNPPKANPEDVRINTGIVNEKNNTLTSQILELNFKPRITAFDKNNIILADFSKRMEEIVIKSFEEENFDDMWKLTVKDLLDVGTCFVEEAFVQKSAVEREIRGLDVALSIDPFHATYTEVTKRLQGICTANLLPGNKVYLGNMREFFIEKQPYVFTIEYMPYEVAKETFGHMYRFSDVPDSLTEILPDSESEFINWGRIEACPDERWVEVAKFYCAPENRFQLYLNSVPMLPCKTPLSLVSFDGSYPVSKGDNQPINRYFAYSKSDAAKTRVDQAVLDEMMRIFVLKFRRMVAPPTANNTGRYLSRDVFLPGKMPMNIDPSQLQPLLPGDQISQGEFMTFEFFRNMLNDKTVSKRLNDVLGNPNATATGVIEAKRERAAQLGLTLHGITSLHRSISYKRLMNILKNYTNPYDTSIDELRGELKDMYYSFTVDTADERGVPGKRIIQFTDNADISLKQIKDTERELSKSYGMPVKVSLLNAKEIQKVKCTFSIQSTVSQKETDELEKLMFTNTVREGLGLFGAQAFKMPALIQMWARKSNLDPDTVLQPSGEIGQQIVQEAQPNGGNLSEKTAKGVAAGSISQPNMPSGLEMMQ